MSKKEFVKKVIKFLNVYLTDSSKKTSKNELTRILLSLVGCEKSLNSSEATVKGVSWGKKEIKESSSFEYQMRGKLHIGMHLNGYMNLLTTFTENDNLQQTDANVREGRSNGKSEHQEEDDERGSLIKDKLEEIRIGWILCS